MFRLYQGKTKQLYNITILFSKLNLILANLRHSAWFFNFYKSRSFSSKRRN